MYDNDKVYVCGGDCEECPNFENCFMTDEDVSYNFDSDPEIIEEFDALQKAEGIYDDSDIPDDDEIRCPKCGKLSMNCSCDIPEIGEDDFLDQQFEDRISGFGE